MNQIFLAVTLITVLFGFLPVHALEPPIEKIGSTNLVAWQNSIDLETSATARGKKVDFSFMVEQPKEGVRWNVGLELYQGTNRLGFAPIGYGTRSPLFTRHLKSSRLTNRTIQQFYFSVDVSLVTNSLVTFQRVDVQSDFPDFPYSSGLPFQVRLIDIYNLTAGPVHEREVSLRVRLFAVSPEAKRALNFEWLKADKMLRQTNSGAASAVLADGDFQGVMRAFAAAKGVEALEDCKLSITNGMIGESRMRFTATNADGMVLDKEFRVAARPTVSTGGKAIDFEITPTWSVSLNTNSWKAGEPTHVGSGPIVVSIGDFVPPTYVRAITLKSSVLEGQTAVFSNIRDSFSLHLREGKELNATFSTSDKNELILFVTATRGRTHRTDGP